MRTIRFACLVLAALLLIPASLFADSQLKDDEFAIEYGPQGITSIKRVQDAQYLSTGGVVIQYKSPDDKRWNVAREVKAADDAAPSDKSIKYSIAGALQVNGATGDVVIEKK